MKIKEIYKDRFYTFLFIIVVLYLLFMIGILSQASTMYELKADKRVVDMSAKILAQQVGVKEVGNNTGVEVERYLTSVGLRAGNAYCYAGQYYCLQQAALILNSYVPIKRTGNCQIAYMDAMKRGKQVPFVPRVNVLTIWRLGVTMSGHAGRIVKVLGMGWVYTIEFNTGLNAREGSGVELKKRQLTNPLARMKLRGIISFRGV